MNKKKILLIVTIMLVFITSCGTIDPNDVDKDYVKDAFEEYLNDELKGIDYKLTIDSFDESNDRRPATGTVKLKDKYKTVCTINGSIRDQYFDASKIGSDFDVYSDCITKILETADKKVNKKNFEMNSETDYDVLAEDIKTYIKNLKTELKEYKKVEEIKKYLSNDYDYFYDYITVNGYRTIPVSFYIDSCNSLVILLESGSSFSWRGEIELSEYLELLHKNRLNETIQEITNKRNGNIKVFDY